MTDAEIIKAKAHFEYGIKCDIFSEPVLSYAETVLEAFDLINRQKAEIELLRKANDEGLNSCLSVMSYFHEEQAVFAKRFYNAGIKEFAERFESKLNCIPQHHFTLAQVLFDLDKTKKEMAGDTE